MEGQLLVDNLISIWDKDKDRFDFSLIKNSKKIKDILSYFDKFSSEIGQTFKIKHLDTSLDHVLVIGPTGSGKSTLINYLTGNVLKCSQVGRNGSPTIIEAERNGVHPVIGNNLSSETKLISHYTCAERNTEYWDFPGFFDSRGFLKKIENAFLIKSFSKKVGEVKIVLVIEENLISTLRGDSFVSCLSILSDLCPANQIQDNLSLIITKCDSYNSDEEYEDYKIYFIDTISNFLREHKNQNYTPFLELFSKREMMNKIALFPKIIRKGSVSNEYLNDILSAIGESGYKNTIFRLCLDSDSSNKILTLANILNRYAQHITQSFVDARIKEVCDTLHKSDFKINDVELIQGFSINPTNICEECKYLNSEYGGISDIDKVIKFFHILSFKCKSDYLEWVQPFYNFDSAYKQLFQHPNIDTTVCGVMTISCCVLFASTLKEVFKVPQPCIIEIRILCFLFILDTDLLFPGINLYILSQEWRNIGSRRISLKGEGGYKKKYINSGNFYGYTKQLKGGTVSFDLNGLDGEDGMFDVLHVKENMDKKESVIRKQLEIIKYLKSLNSRYNLKNEESELAKKRDYLDKEINSIRYELLNYKKRLLNAFCIDRKRLEVEKERKEKSIIALMEELNTVSDNLKFVQKVIELRTIYNKFQNSALDIHYKRTIFKNIVEEINHISDCLENILETSGKPNLDNFLKLDDIVKEANKILNNLKGTNYEQLVYDQMREEEVHTKHLLIKNGTELQLNAKELNDTFTSKSSIKVSLKRELEIISRLNNNYYKEIDKFKIEMMKFQQKHKEFSIQEINHQQKLNNLHAHRIPGWNNLVHVIRKKEQVSNQFYELITAKDSFIHSFSDNHFGSPSVKDKLLLKVVNEETFINEYVKNLETLNKNKSENIDKRLEQQIKVVQDYIAVKTKLQLLFAKNNIEKYNLDNNQYSELKNTEIHERLNQIRRDLKSLWVKEKWFGFITVKRLSNDDIDLFANNLAGGICSKIKKQKKLQHLITSSGDHKKKLDQKYEEYKMVNTEYEIFVKEMLTAPMRTEYFDYLQSYNKLKKIFLEYSEISQNLLFKERNMLQRIKCDSVDMGTNSKISYALKKFFLFNDYFFEKYKISGTEGTNGGNSGAYEFVIESQDSKVKEISREVGKGGLHSYTLEGVYMNGYFLSSLRGIKEIVPSGEASENTENWGSHVFKTISALVMGLTQFVFGPITAIISSKWIDGPFRCSRGRAPDGRSPPSSFNFVPELENYETYIKDIEKNLILTSYLSSTKKENCSN